MGTALIVGAGIGGLAAALALRGAGWDVRVLERARSPRDLGFALLLAPNAVRALRALGVADEVVAGGVVAGFGEMRRPNGEVLRRLDTAAVQARLGEPAVVALRQVLHGTLLEAVGAEVLLLESEVVGMNLVPGGVEVKLAGGRKMTGHLLVGADGVKSVIRHWLRPQEPPPRRSGLFALRGVARDVVPYLGNVSGVQYFGRGVEAGLARATEDSVYWYMSMPADQVRQGSLEPQAVLWRFVPPFHDSFQQIVMATSPRDMRLDELFDRAPVHPWGRGPVTLLGDAAHPMLPHAGQGAAQALEDAVALGRALAANPSPEQGLRDYERVRAPRTAAVVKLARRNAAFGSVRGVVTTWIRDAVIRLVPDRVILNSLVAIGKGE